jgi:hypothetical protein
MLRHTSPTMAEHDGYERDELRDKARQAYEQLQAPA